jgi:hypothetical protein
MPIIPYAEERPFGAGRRAGQRDFETGVGLEEISERVGEAGQLSMRLFEQEMDSRVLGALSGATRAMTDLGQQVEAEPDHNKRMGMYQAGSQKISQEFRKGVKYPKYQELFDARLFQQQESGRIAVLDNVRNAKIASAQATLMMSVETQLDSAKNNPDPIRRAEIYRETFMDISLAEKNGTLGPVAAARMKIQVGNAEETESLLFASYALADEIYDQHTDHVKRREAVREVPAHMRKHVNEVVEERYRREQAQEAEANAAQFNDLVNRARVGGMTMSELIAEEERLRSTEMPLTSNQYLNLDRIIQKESGVMAAREEMRIEQNNSDLLAFFLRLSDTPGKWNEFVDTDLRLAMPLVDPKDPRFTHLQKKQGNGTSDIPEMWNKQINGILAEKGLPHSPEKMALSHTSTAYDDEEREAAITYREVALDLLRAESGDTQGRGKLSERDARKLLVGLFDEVIVESAFWKVGWDTTVPLWKFDPEDVPTGFWYEGFDPTNEEKEDIIREYQSKNNNAYPSDDTIIEMFLDRTLSRQGRSR